MSADMAQRDAQRLQQMQSVRLFAGLDCEVLQTVLTWAQPLDVPAGAEVAREGGEEHDFYVLLEGELVVTLSLGEGIAPLQVGSVQPGGSFGELAALLGERRTATVAASRASCLLRLDVAGLQALFERCPGFGWAFSRELAQGLKAALAVKNELQTEHQPGTVVLDVPAIERMREYTAAYYASALRTLVRQHKLVLDREFPHYEAPLRISAEERAKWHALFGVPAGAATPPFTFHSTVGTLTLMKVVTDVGVNFRNLLHLRSEMALSLRDVEPGRDYRLRARLTDIQVLRGDRVVLVVDSRLDGTDGQLVRSFRDFFVILNLDSHTPSCPRFWLHALNCSGFWHTLSPSWARVVLKLCGLKYASPAASKARLKIARIGDAVLQCRRAKPTAWNCCVSPSSTSVAGNSGSSLPHSFSCRR